MTGIGVSGCEKRQDLPTVQIHHVTKEFLQVCPSGVALGEPISSARLQGRPPYREVGNNHGDTHHPDLTDHLYIALPGSAASATNSAKLTLVRALDRVATRHGLTRGSLNTNVDFLRFEYSYNGTATHTIHIRGPFEACCVTPPENAKDNARARLAIILDDMGQDWAAAEAVFALPFPLTVSVLPNLRYSTEVDHEARFRGYQVMLHLPMDSRGHARAEAMELHGGMSGDDVSDMVAKMLETVPDAIGVNNHQGSRATTDGALMAALMPALRDRKLFFVDSRTSVDTIAFDTARRMGVSSYYRNVPFLDDAPEFASIRHRLQMAIRDARTHGSAIAIGHPRAATLRALREVLPQVDSQGVMLVFVSELVR